MSILKIKQTVQSALVAAFPSTPIAFESVDFEEPEQVYLRITFTPGKPTDSTYGNKYYRENVRVNIFVVGAKSKGTSEVLTLAEQVRSTFDRGWVQDVDNLRIHVFTKPQISGVGVTDAKIVVPVFIEFTVEVNE